jgi:hypothetical protein
MVAVGLGRSAPAPPHLLRGHLGPLHLGDALLNGFGLFLQTLQVLLQPGDPLLFGPEASPEVDRLTASARTTVMSATTGSMVAWAAVMAAPMPAAGMTFIFTAHDITSFPYKTMLIN